MILYEDEALVVCLKPRGLRSAPDASGKGSMADLLAPRHIFPVHRLDREVPGVMVFAKTSQAAAFLSAAMGTDFCKEYLALTTSAPEPPDGTMEDLLFHDRGRNKTYVVARKRAGVKSAKLHYRTLATFSDGRAAVHVRLETGRTHQIRVQFASRKCPLQGDGKYGGTGSGPIELYAWRLTFPHPEGSSLCFCLPEEHLPPELRNCREAAL